MLLEAGSLINLWGNDTAATGVIIAHKEGLLLALPRSSRSLNGPHQIATYDSLLIELLYGDWAISSPRYRAVSCSLPASALGIGRLSKSAGRILLLPLAKIKSSEYSDASRHRVMNLRASDVF